MPVPSANLEVDFAVEAGAIRPLHDVNLGPLFFNGWFDASAIYRPLAFPLTRLHDCPYAVPETVDVHSIFPIFGADPQDPVNYRFAPTDDYIQAILDTGSQIVYRLGESIEHHTRRKYWVHPPADFEKWAAICVNIVRHYNEGWADGFHHGIRYWEIWNEPWLIPNCWTGTQEDYFRLYEVAAQALKAHDPALMVGGPSCAGSGGPGDFGARFLDHCRATGASLDFYTWHLYTRDPLEIAENAVQVRDLLARHGFERAESHLNEWNYLPAEGWRFNSPEKEPDCIRRAVNEIGGTPGAAFDAAVLALMQDLPIDVANFYWVRDGFWGILDSCGAPRKNYYAFRAFRSLLDTPRRVQATPNDPRTGYALLSGKGDARRAGILLANARGREATFALAVRNWPWEGRAVCRYYHLDDDRDLALAGEFSLDGAGATVPLCIPAPAFAFLTLTPHGDDGGGF